jgi:hypothetical protein
MRRIAAMRRPTLRGALVISSLALIVFLLGATAAQGASPLIAQWGFEEPETTGPREVVPDESGNGNDLSTEPFTMRFGTEGGKFGQYLSGFETAAPEVTSPSLAPQRLTLLAWIKQEGNPGTLRYIAGRGDDGGGSCSGGSYDLYTGYPGAEGLRFYIRTTEPGAPPVLSEAAPESVFDGDWHLVAGTFDGSDVRFYVDGAQVGPAMPAPGIAYGAPITGQSFYVARYAPEVHCPDSGSFPGDIDEVRVYDRALSGTELARLAAAPGPTPPVLVPDPGAEEPAPPTPPAPPSEEARAGGGTVNPRPPTAGPSAPPLGLTLRGPASAPATNFAVIALDATGPVAETKLKVDGKPALSVPPGTTSVGLNLSGIGTHSVTATTIGVGGGQVTQSTSVTVTKPGGFRAPAPDTAVATTNAALFTEALKRGQCVPNTTIVFGVVETNGCFSQIDPVTELPASEKGVAEEYVATNTFLEIEAGKKPCALGKPGCAPDPNAAFGRDPAARPFVSWGPMHVDGMTISPVGNAAIVVFPAIQRIVSSNAKITYDGSVFGSIPVQSGPLNLDLSSGLLHFSNGSEGVRLFSFDTSKAFDDIGGFPINGTVTIDFTKEGEHRFTKLEVNLSLPEELSTAAGADPTAKVDVDADNARGTYLGLLNIHMNKAFIGPVELANVDFTYNDAGEPAQGCPRKWWKATAEVFFLPGDDEGGGLKMAPEPQRNGIAFCAGSFHSAGAELTFPALAAPEILPGVTLRKVGFSFQLHDPVVFDGSATIKSAELVTATGGFLAAFATPSHPYTFSAADAGGALPALRGKTFTSTTLAIGGKVELEPYEEIGLELGSAYLLYSYPDYIVAEGSAHLQTFLFTVNAKGALELSTSTGRFNALVEGEICLLGGIKIAHVGLCAGGEGRISSRGISVCFNILDGTWTPGVGYVYGHAFPEFFAGAFGDGCKPSHFWETDVRGVSGRAVTTTPAAGRAARRLEGFSPDLTFTVAKGESVKNIELVGAEGAPAVTVVAPNGEQLSSEPNQMLHGKKLSLISADKYQRTWIGVEEAVPGTYKVILQPGSTAVSNQLETREEPEAGVSASVTGSGDELTLHYDAGHAKDQTVSFYERGKGSWELLKKVDGGKGTVDFEPSDGPAGKRELAAQVEVDGIPAPIETLDHFKAPPPPQAQEVDGVEVAHHGDELKVSWDKAAGSQEYAVVSETRGGTVKEQRVTAKRTSATLRDVSATEGGHVEVVSFGPLGDQGKAGQATFKALREQVTRLLPYKELGTGEAAKKSGDSKKGGSPKDAADGKRSRD